MMVDKGAFLLALGAFAAGGAGGYVARDRNVVGPHAGEPPEPAGLAATRSSGGVTAPQAPPPVQPACNDMAGAPADCPPPPYSADESGCAPVATKRCEDFKQSMKPRVAEQAVACILALNPAQRCDPARVNLCGHLALMNACTSGDQPAASSAGGDDVAARCQAISLSCPTASRHDCEATLGGMTAVGRERMARCMSTHCADKGLVGCEAVGEAK
jgi:hypothetical protein